MRVINYQKVQLAKPTCPCTLGSREKYPVGGGGRTMRMGPADAEGDSFPCGLTLSAVTLRSVNSLINVTLTFSEDVSSTLACTTPPRSVNCGLCISACVNYRAVYLEQF